MSCKQDNCEIYADFQYLIDKQTEFWDEFITGSGTSTWNNNGYIEMEVDTNNEKVVRQTKEYFTIKTGKTRKCLFTAVLNNITNTGFTSRVGIFDDHNDKTSGIGGSGFFFELKDNVLYVVIRYGLTDNGTDTKISQSNFNVNKLKQATHLRINNWDNIYTFEILHNNIGMVEWAIYIDGERIPLHREQDLSRVINTLPRYSLPLRFEIEKTSSSATVGKMCQFNASICHESGSGYNIPDNGDSNDNSCKGIAKHLSKISCILHTINSRIYKPLFSFRLKSTELENPIKFYELMFLIHQQGSFIYCIVKNPTFTGDNPNWLDAGSDCRLEYDIYANQVDTSNLDIIFEEYVYAHCRGGIFHENSGLNFCLPEISNTDGTADIYTVIVKKLGCSCITANFNLRWLEE